MNIKLNKFWGGSCMGMTKKEIQALETAALEFFRDGKAEMICPRCGNPIKVHVNGNSHKVALR